MVTVSRDRAVWLSRYVLPNEADLRAWLRHRPVVDLEIDDIVQEAYARLAALETVENIRQPRNYLFQTAYSIIVSHVRRSKVIRLQAVSDLSQLDVASNEASPEQRVEAREELRQIAEFIASLPDVCRSVFILRRIEEVSQRDVALRLGLTENVVEHQMARAIRLLTVYLGSGGKHLSRSSVASGTKVHSVDERKEILRRNRRHRGPVGREDDC